MAKKSNKVTPKVEGFIMRNLRSGKNTVAKHGTTGIIALIMGSVIPMLQSWHADQQHATEVLSIRNEASGDTDAAEKRNQQLIKDLDDRTDKHIIEVESNEDAKIKAVWDYISKQKR